MKYHLFKDIIGTIVIALIIGFIVYLTINYFAVVFAVIGVTVAMCGIAFAFGCAIDLISGG
jgi:hypothetical protein